MNNNNNNRGITMVGIRKECVKCGKPFLTLSTKTGWQKLCNECYQERRTTSAVKTIGRENQSILMSVEHRLEKLENVFDFSPLIEEEIKNQMSLISPSDIRNKIQKQVNNSLAELKEVNEKNFKDLREKVQKHTVVLNNRIIELERRLNKWLDEN